MVSSRCKVHKINVIEIVWLFKLLALLVSNFDPYLATSYPIFHQTSVLKGRLLTLLAILIILQITLAEMSLNDSIIPFHLYIVVLLIFLILPMLFVFYKLFIVVRKRRTNREVSSEVKKTFSLKHIVTCLLACSCLLCCVISAGVCVCWTTDELDVKYNGWF